MESTIGGVLSGVLVAAFLYFIYTKVKKAREKPKSTGGSGGGSRREPGDTHLK